MAFSFTGFLKGILLENETDRTKQLAIQASSTATTGTTMTVTASQTTNRTLTLPDATDTLTANAATQTLTNKTMDGGSNTFTNLPSSALSGTVSIANGGTGQTTQQAALDALAGSTTSGSYLRGNGTHVLMSTIQAGDVPTLNQSTTGTAANITASSNSTLTTLTALTTASSLASVGTITSGTWNGSTIDIAHGGTGQTTANAAFNALSPMTTHGDIIFGGTAGAGTRLGAGTAGQVLTTQGTSSDPTWTSVVTNPMTTLGDTIVGGSGGTPQRLAVGLNGQALGADSTATNGVSWQNPANYKNRLVNGAFDYWQVNTTVNATGSQLIYGADQWFIDNSGVGGSGQSTLAQVTGVTDGSVWGASGKLTVAGTTAGVVVAQLLSNQATMPLYNKTASATVLVKALGNVNQVSIQFISNTSETRTSYSNIGSAVTASVNSSTFTAVTVNGQALGTGMTTSGIVGIKIAVTGVSTGHTWDLNNGFVLEQAGINLGPVAIQFQRQYDDPVQELAACQYFYEKTYDVTVVPGTNTATGRSKIAVLFNTSTNIGNSGTGQRYLIPKRAAPSLTMYSSAGTSGHLDYQRAGAATADIAGTISGSGLGAFSITSSNASGATAGDAGEIAFHYVADARM